MNQINKSFLILFLCFMNINEVKSQGYIPMLNDSLYWDIAYADMNVIICNEYGNTGSGPYRYAIEKDTLLNGVVYKKFKSYRFFSLLPQPSPNCAPFGIDTFVTNSPTTTYLYLREDTVAQKVYEFDTNFSQEYILYDFDVQIGDSVFYSTFGDFIVDTIYSIVTMDGKVRRVIQCSTSTHPICGYYIEGLGGVAGVLHEPYGVFESGPWLMCVSDLNHNIIYSPNPGNCFNFATGVESHENFNITVTMFPNPADNFLHFENLPPNTRIKIVDNYGNIIKDYQDVLDNKISISSLNSGMYFVHFRNNSTVLTYKKFIKIQ